MRFVTAFVSLLTLVAAAPHVGNGHPHLSSRDMDSTPLDARQSFRRKAYCPKRGVHMIVNSGAGAPQIRGYGLLQTTVESIRAALPGSTNYSIPFDKTTNTTLGPAAVAQGVQLLTENIAWYTENCPKVPVVIIGYSQGAIVAMNTLCGRSVANSLPYGTPLDSKYASNIIATIIYGDGTRRAGEAYNLGSCTTGSGYLPRQNPAGCGAFAPKMQSYCEINDPRCCNPSPAPDPNQHFVYPGLYDATITNYVVQQYKARRPNSNIALGTPVPDQYRS